MLLSLDSLIEGYQNTIDRSKAECGNELEKIRLLSRAIFPYFFDATEKAEKTDLPKYWHSLVYCCFLELVKTSGNILFLSSSGLYRNAFDEIRYSLEHVVQSLYIDIRHPETKLDTKIEILKEIEDKREYHSVRLIDELKIDHKDKLKKQYKELSKKIHPSHKQTIDTLTEIFVKPRSKKSSSKEVIDCEKISKIYISMEAMYDIFFFLFLFHFPEFKRLKDDQEFMKNIESLNLFLLRKTLRGSDLRKKT